MWNTVAFLLLVRILTAFGNTVAIDEWNLNTILPQHQLVFAAFGAEWCPYSRNLKPTFEEAAAFYKRKNPTADVVWATVDCESQRDICDRFYVNKYPTMKLFVFGDMMKNEYRGMRAVDPLCDYIDEHYTSTIKIFSDNSFQQGMDKSKGNVIAYIQKGDEAYKNLHNIALLLHEYCDFWVPSDEIARSLSKFRITFKAVHEENEYEVTWPNWLFSSHYLFGYSGDPRNYSYLKDWISDKCIPIVREVTFQNVEGLTEEGLPFLIFFRDKENKEHDKLFIDAVVRELYGTRMTINPLLADGRVFAHPLQHLGSAGSGDRLFVHMFVFPNISELSKPGVLKAG
ncbi:thioredoxin [Ostertagia ostertagi]